MNRLDRRPAPPCPRSHGNIHFAALEELILHRVLKQADGQSVLAKPSEIPLAPGALRWAL
ncbi:hypothetical protein ABHF33_00985 [Chitinibacter sp. FCG-7]|uniref:Uncharacterized protein n=1 Tax=Chitinibacter mangrovi TaxID=3153927 RepID=A0AAU7FAD5_9NEIS